MFLTLIIAIPLLFIIGVFYNTLKDQKKLESETLPKILKERQRRTRLPKDHPDYQYITPYDDDDEDNVQRSVATHEKK